MTTKDGFGEVIDRTLVALTDDIVTDAGVWEVSEGLKKAKRKILALHQEAVKDELKNILKFSKNSKRGYCIVTDKLKDRIEELEANA